MLKEHIVKNKAVFQSQAVYLRNLENQMGQLAIALSNRPQRSLLSNTEVPRRKCKEHCKVINLRSRKEIQIPVGVSKRRGEPTLIHEKP